MRRIQRLDKELIASLQPLVPDPEARDDMGIPSYLHSNPLINWLFWRRLETAIRLLGDGSFETVLDYGCGIGSLLPTLSASARLVYGCDKRTVIAQEVVTRLGLSNVQIITVPQFSELGNGSVDAIISADVLEHVDQLENLVSELRAKLRSNGILVVSGPTENWLYRLGRASAGFSGHYHVRNIDDINRVIRAAGFQKMRRVVLPFRLLPPFLSLFHVYAYRRCED